MRELLDILHRRANASGERGAFDDGETRLAYAPMARRVAAAAEDLRALPSSPATIGILGGHGIDSIVGLLAGWQAGKVVVPLPAFFHVSQLQHIVRDAGIAHVVATPDMAAKAAELGGPFTMVTAREAGIAPLEDGSGGGLITYTSGSTGQPKGVLLGSGQMMWTARALADAIDASSDDAYLSVLPLALLLETICAVIVPVLVGAPVRLAPEIAGRPDIVDGAAIADAVAAHRPSCMVLVPHLLGRWVAALGAGAASAPDSLRVVAVGGAAVPPALAEQGWKLGIPVHEGYGLSECGSVVSLNRPGDRKPGTVGKPLPGLSVRVEGCEIVVQGPPVMDRYLHGKPTRGIWRTGDAGEVDAEGVLTVRGRLDNLIITPVGRNISPEWIESRLGADGRVAQCIVAHVGGPQLTALVVPTAGGEDWFKRANVDDISGLVAECCRDVPGYAVPGKMVVILPDELAPFDLPTGGEPRKAMLKAYGSMSECRRMMRTTPIEGPMG